jgi:hypothetical protein
MKLGPGHRRWLLVGPGLLVAGVLAPAAAGLLVEPRRAASFGVALVCIGVFTSLVSVPVAIGDHWPPFRGWPRTDSLILLAGSIPLILLAAVICVVVLDIGA